MKRRSISTFFGDIGRSLSRGRVAAALAGLTTMLLSGPAAADVTKVHPGESIQTAIDQASPGDTIKLAPGTYHESVQIKTDGITLKGAGADQTVIEPGTSAGQGI